MFLFLIPTVIMGIGFPIALQAWADHVHKVGRSTGTAYAANTIGAVMGGVVTGFVLIPLLGLQLAVSSLGLVGVWIAAFLYMSFARSSTVVIRVGLFAVVAILATVAVKMPSNLFDSVVESNPMVSRRLKLLTVREGATTTVSMYRNLEEGTLYLYTSGVRVAGDTYFWRGDQKMLGHFGILLNSSAKKVLSVGFGSGESTACMALHKLDRADCVEIAPEVVDVSLRYFPHINLGGRLNDEINMIYMDAKNYIHLTDIKYDAIVNDSIHPRMFADNASLYTKEYFESAKAHLTDKGLFMSWIPAHDVEPAPVMNSIIGTVMDVFPEVTIWFMTTTPASYFFVVGSEQPQYFSPRYIDNELLKNGVRDSLSLIDINNSMDLLSCYIGDKEDLKRRIKSYRLNSDYYPFIEFSTDTMPGGSAMFEDFVFDIRNDSIYKHIDWTGFSQEQKSEWLSDFKRLRKASTYLLLSHSANNSMEKLKLSMKGLAVLPGNPALHSLSERAAQALLSPHMQATRTADLEAALQMAEIVLTVYPRSPLAWIVKSNAAERMGDMQKALEAARMAVDFGPDDAQSHLQLASVLRSSGQFDEAIEECKTSVRLAEQSRKLNDYHRVGILSVLETTYTAAGRLEQAIATAEKALELASSAGQEELAEQIKKRLSSLKAADNARQQR